MVLNPIQMEPITDKMHYVSLRGEQAGPFTLEQLRAKALGRATLVWNEKHWVWTPAGRMAEFFGPASRPASAVGGSFRRWFGQLRERVMRARHLQQGSELAH